MSDTIQLVLILCATYVLTTLINKIKFGHDKAGKYQKTTDEPQRKEGAKR